MTINHRTNVTMSTEMFTKRFAKKKRIHIAHYFSTKITRAVNGVSLIDT
jgi:hypothetical protein